MPMRGKTQLPMPMRGTTQLPMPMRGKNAALIMADLLEHRDPLTQDGGANVRTAFLTQTTELLSRADCGGSLGLKSTAYAASQLTQRRRSFFLELDGMHDRAAWLDQP